MAGSGNSASYPPSFPASQASIWRRIRRYAVPRWMIEEATERREAGDWRGACAAANVDVLFDLASVATEYGSDTAAVLEDDLRYFAPDLLRWHLPRCLDGRTTLRPDVQFLLSGYGDQPGTGPYLYVRTPRQVDDSQRVTLRFGKGPGNNAQNWRTHNWLTSRHLWDTRRAGDLRHRCGAHDERARRLTALYDSGEIERACREAGIVLDKTLAEAAPAFYDESGAPKRMSIDPDDYYAPHPLPGILSRLPLAVTRLEPEIRLLAAAGAGNRFHIPSRIRKDRLTAVHFELRPGGGVTVRPASMREVECLPLTDVCWRRLPDLDLLRFGDIAPDDLHPLVTESLFPGRSSRPADEPASDGAPSTGPEPVRVRCGGQWHEVGSAGGRLRVLSHTGAEERRERAMRAFGGPVPPGCFAVQEAWRAGTKRLPKALREQRRELLSYVQHGDTPAVLRLLEAGLDPHVRNDRGQTLLHLLPLLGHEELLPRLLDASLDLEARDREQYTPLCRAVAHGGSVDLVRALLDAGAQTDVTIDIGYGHGLGLQALIVGNFRAQDLRFLKDAVERDYPALTIAVGAEDRWEE